ncbi:unnamed protein product, partial [Candidula unifasciata]
VYNSSLREGQKKRGDKTSESESDLSKSWSPTRLPDSSDLSPYKERRPRSSSLTQTYKLSSSDTSFSTSFLSKGKYSDNSTFNSSQKAAKRKTECSSSMVSVLPDTQELCRRLEEKIDGLTRMGGNLVKENQEMAELISVQGEKLSAVKQTGRKAWEK